MFGIKEILSGLGGAFIALSVAIAYNSFIENPSIKKETKLLTQAKSREHTQKVINEISDIAEKARAMRRHCIDSGLRYNSATVACRKD